MKTMIRLLPVIAILVALGSPVLAAAPPAPYFNGFEKNTDGWFDSTNGGDGTITRRPSGYSNSGGYADGIASAAGKWHARLVGSPCFTPPNQDCTGPFTRWGGYSSTFPTGGYLTQVDIYLDVNWAATHSDYRFDWDSSINDNTGNFRRDWVFNVGTQLPLQSPHFIIQSSTNAFRSGANPNAPCPNPVAPPNSCRPPLIITTSGWYTFRHTFHDDGSGFLAVDFDIFPLGSNVALMHQTIDSNPYDPMSVIGGNRYGWFANEEIPDLPIDNSLRTGLCRDADGDGETDGKNGGKGHFKVHKHSCDNGDNDNVSEDDDESNTHFQSTSITSATFTQDDTSQTVTIIGTGLDNGLPVGFTMVAIDNNGLAPSVFGLTLTDGYVILGNLTSGSLVVQ
jgi:hypothetical protein